MVKILDMQLIRYSNLFERVTKLKSKHCFLYNNMIVFVVPRKLIARAIGKENVNLKKLSEITKRRIKVVPEPSGIEDIENFVSVIVAPIKFRALEVKDGEALITATIQSKASLIGRDKIRLEEMENILKQYFDVKKVRIL
jgi:N utilization substance protein A